MANTRSDDDRSHDTRHGRLARRPDEFTRTGWRDILLRTWSEITSDNIDVVAAGVAFYALLALFPALAVLVSAYGLVADPADVAEHVASLNRLLPSDVADIINEQLVAVATAPKESLGFGVIFGLLFTLWSAMGGVKTIIVALNIAYDEDEKRSFLKLNLLALLFTLGAIVMMIFTLVMVVGLSGAMAALHFGTAVEWLVSIGRWPILAAFVVFAIAVLYRYGPSRERPRWQWVSTGAVFATVFWIIASMGFSLYVRNFGSYNETYGSLGAVVVLIMWFWISAYILLAGAELNAEMEHQTRKDTTTGPEMPMGKRQAYVADTLGQSR